MIYCVLRRTRIKVLDFTFVLSSHRRAIAIVFASFKASHLQKLWFGSLLSGSVVKLVNGKLLSKGVRLFLPLIGRRNQKTQVVMLFPTIKEFVSKTGRVSAFSGDSEID